MFGKKTILFAVVILSMFIAGIATHVSSATTLQGGRMAALQGGTDVRSDGPCWTCDAMVSCEYCMPTGSSSSVTCTDSMEEYIECPKWGATQSDHCGTCTSWGNDCGTYLICTGTACASCSAIDLCDGCDVVIGANPCPS